MKLRDRFMDVAARRRLAGTTVQCYWRWVEDFLRFHRTGGRWMHPSELKERDIEAYLNDLARGRRVSASTQNQALNAVVFLYKQVLVDEVGPEHLGRFEAERARRPKRMPTVLSASEVRRVLAAVSGNVQPCPGRGRTRARHRVHPCLAVSRNVPECPALSRRIKI